LGLLASAFLFAQGGRGGGGGGNRGNNLGSGGGGMAMSPLDRITTALKLNKDQKKLLRTTFDEAQKEAAPVRDQIAKGRVAIAEAIAGAKSQDEIDAAVKSEAELETQMVSVEMRAFAKVFESLDQDQQTRVSLLFRMMHGLFNGRYWDEIKY
jgi:hypothetical protein